MNILSLELFIFKEFLQRLMKWLRGDITPVVEQSSDLDYVEEMKQYIEASKSSFNP